MCHKDQLVAAVGTMSWPSSCRKERVGSGICLPRHLD
jgi:hypothetical protein